MSNGDLRSEVEFLSCKSYDAFYRKTPIPRHFQISPDVNARPCTAEIAANPVHLIVSRLEGHGRHLLHD